MEQRRYIVPDYVTRLQATLFLERCDGFYKFAGGGMTMDKREEEAQELMRVWHNDMDRALSMSSEPQAWLSVRDKAAEMFGAEDAALRAENEVLKEKIVSKGKATDSYIAAAQRAKDRDSVRILQLTSSLKELVYEITHLSPESENGSHLSVVSGEALQKARAALAQKEG